MCHFIKTQDGSLLKYSKLQKKVIQLQWTKWGLAACTAESKVGIFTHVMNLFFNI